MTSRNWIVVAAILCLALLMTGLATGSPSTTCVSIGTYDSDNDKYPTTLLLEQQDGGFGDIAETTDDSNPEGCNTEELRHYYIYTAPPGEYIVHVRNDQEAVNERWGAFEVTVGDVDEETFAFQRVEPYHTSVGFESLRDSHRFEPEETADFNARVYNGGSTSRDVTTEVYIYPEGSDRPDVPTERLSSVTVYAGGHTSVQGSVPMPDSEGEYTVDIEFVTDLGFGEFTSDYVDIGAVTVDSFEPPRIDGASPEEGSINVGPTDDRSFSVDVSDPDSTPTVQWYVDGERWTSGTVYEFDAERFEPGEHTVEVVASDDTDLTDDARMTWTIDVAEPPEITSVSPGNEEVTLGRTVTFSADTESAGHDYEWTIGDRSFTGPSVETAFGSTGEKRITVAVTNDRGVTATRSFDVVVRQVPPSIEDMTISPGTIYLGERVTFSADAQDPADRGTDFDYEWEIGSRTVNGASVEANVAEAGTHDVVLTVTNEFGVTTTRTQTLDVDTVPPEITDLSVTPSSPTAGETVSMRVTASDPMDRGSDLSYEWTVNGKNFSGARAETRLSEVGTHDVSLTVANEYGVATTRTRSVVVENDEPSIERLSPAAQATTRTGTEQRFDVRIVDHDAESATVTWSVNGEQTSVETISAAERRLSFTQVFEEPGSQTVEVTVEDGNGARASLDWTVDAANRPPRIERVSPDSSAFDVMSGTTKTFEANATDPESTTVRYRWLVDGDRQSTGPRYAHTFNATGVRNVTVVAVDADGGTTTHTWSTSVRNFRATPEIDSSATVSELRPGESTEFIALSFRNPSVNNRTAEVELALSLPSGVTVSTTRNVRGGSQPEYVGQATVSPGQQTSISLAVAVEDDSLAGERVNVPYQVIYYPEGQRDSYRIIENATTTMDVIGSDPTKAGDSVAGDASSAAGETTGTTGGSGPGFTGSATLLAVALLALRLRK